MCEDSAGILTGVQLTNIIQINKPALKLNAFGNVKTKCQTLTLKKGSYVSKFTIRYKAAQPDKIEYIRFETSDGGKLAMGFYEVGQAEVFTNFN